VSAFIGALSEAWSELRHHKLRVLLSLIGIAVSVAAITAVVAFGEYQRQFTAEQSDRSGGRVATIAVSPNRTDGLPMDWQSFDERFDRVAERFDFSHATRVFSGVQMQLQTPEYVRPVTTRLVDPAYPVIHRSPIAEGRWFRASDADLLSPPVVLGEALWESLGEPSLGAGATVTFVGEGGGTYTVVGVEPRQWAGDEEKTATILYDSYASRVDRLSPDIYGQWEVWVPEDIVAELGPVLAMDLRAGLEGIDVAVSRSDWGSRPEAASAALVFELVTGAIAGLVLLLGGLGLVNIQLVAMRQRIREIGVRRSFGASAGRIFTTVLLENVVATAVAGVVGIAIVIAVLRAPFILEMFPGMQDVPPFPVRAAVTGLVAAVAIGAIAGFLPALAAVRAKVIDALRF
jgi:putative ABC transport system permease protein